MLRRLMLIPSNRNVQDYMNANLSHALRLHRNNHYMQTAVNGLMYELNGLKQCLNDVSKRWNNKSK